MPRPAVVNVTNVENTINIYLVDPAEVEMRAIITPVDRRIVDALKRASQPVPFH